MYTKSSSLLLQSFIFSTLCMRINLSDPKVRMVFGITKCLLEYRVFLFQNEALTFGFYFFHKKAAGCQGQRSLSVASIVRTSFKLNLWGQLATLISSTVYFQQLFFQFLGALSQDLKRLKHQHLLHTFSNLGVNIICMPALQFSFQLDGLVLHIFKFCSFK